MNKNLIARLTAWFLLAVASLAIAGGFGGTIPGSAAVGTVSGTGTDNHIPKFDGTANIQNTDIVCDDSENCTGFVSVGLDAKGSITFGASSVQIFSENAGATAYSTIDAYETGLVEAAMKGTSSAYYSIFHMNDVTGANYVVRVQDDGDGTPTNLFAVYGDGQATLADALTIGTVVVKPYSGSIIFNFALQAAAGSEDSTGITVTGAAMGDTCNVATLLEATNVAGSAFSCRVTTANEVKVRHVCATACNPDSDTFYVKVWKR